MGDTPHPVAAPPLDANYTIGIDLGQVYDYSALAVVERLQGRNPSGLARLTTLDHHQVRHIKRWEKGTTYAKVVEDTGDLMRRGRLDHAIIVLDATGVGKQVAELFLQAFRLGKLGRYWPRPYVITGGRDITDRVVPKLELVGKMQTLLQTGRLKIADSLPLADALRKELMAFKVKMTPGGQETYESATAGAHDDIVIAVALACWYRHVFTEPRWIEEPQEARA